MRSLILAFLMTAGLTSAAWADCNDAIDSYNSAISEIDYQLGRFTNCLSSSQGEDDCSSEFRRLRNAHGDFESAVSDYRRECDA